jgi:hypothetical protein
MRRLNTKNLEKLIAAGKPFKCTGTVPEMQRLLNRLPPALTMVDYPGEGCDEVTVTYYPRSTAPVGGL